MKTAIRFFLSLKTASVLFLIFIVLMFVGSLSLPGNLAFFSGIDDTLLFKWLAGAGAVRITWWIYATIGMLGLLALSTVLCTADALLNWGGRGNFLLKLSPQVMHMGVLFIMLGHLLTASSGIKEDVLVKEGAQYSAAGGAVSFVIEDIDAVADENGYFTDWSAGIWRIDGGKKAERELLIPTRPIYFGGIGFFFKSINMGSERSIVVRVCRDPGAPWALFGGIVLSVGCLGFVYGRFGGRSGG